MARRKRGFVPIHKPLLSRARIAEMQEFARELAALCRRYRFELSGSRDSCESIEVYDATDAQLPEGFNYVGMFGHVDADGIFSLAEDGVTKTRQPGIDVCEWVKDISEPEWQGPTEDATP